MGTILKALFKRVKSFLLDAFRKPNVPQYEG